MFLARRPGKAGNKNKGPSQWDKHCFRGYGLGGRARRHENPRRHIPPIDRIGGRRFNLYSNGTPGVSEGTSSEAEPAATQARAAHTPPINIIGGRRFSLYSNGTPSIFEGAAGAYYGGFSPCAPARGPVMPLSFGTAEAVP